MYGSIQDGGKEVGKPRLLYHQEGISLTFDSISYAIEVDGERRVILQNVSGHVPAGRTCAIIGPSGAGKSTLLDCLANRKTIGEATGTVYLNGETVPKRVLQRHCGYVLQDDLFLGGLTVHETLQFSARLRLPESVGDAERAALVDGIIDDLGLSKVKDSKIGNQFYRGLSGGEKKRLSIACELVTQPTLILLDEPTSGLDALAAFRIVETIRTLCRDRHQTAVLSIHQPSSDIYRLFDLVLLLSEDGRPAYFGEADLVMEHFEKHLKVRAHTFTNPADFLLNLVVARERRITVSYKSGRSGGGGVGDDDEDEGDPLMRLSLDEICAAHAATSVDLQRTLAECQATSRDYPMAMADSPAGRGGLLVLDTDSRYVTGFPRQFYCCLERFIVNWLRDPIASVVFLSVSVIFGLLLGSMYYPLENTQKGIQDRLGCLFFIVMNAGFQNLSALEIFLLERSIFHRERARSMYRTSAYLLGKLLGDLPQRLIPMIVFSAIVYWFAGFYPSVTRFLTFVGFQFLVAYTSYSFCLLVSAFAPSYAIANLICPLWIVLLMLPGGYLVNSDSIPVYWAWLEYLSFHKYGFAALVINEFEGQVFTCTEDEYVCPPLDPSSIGCVCPVTSGDAVIASLGMNPDFLPFDMVILLAMISAYLLAAFLTLSFLQKEVR
mmetsp:Transcript_23666/g.66384  ORF Transcript_23666/g.66384 Transcript_23666/m.66384 type:complete len:664 (+) Transcript_23666:75-2066(+)|eukprot:CAMPEP_0119125096 /NCGR_PEP_ID=MMETSP1310-20130426/4484_1 /TAXON_ID=464262 /ORGANISM="Genus nov. species nov., Strain RCC2339" /LENGTH=663 /DNA_ID=CAMNT_0007115127 /DNA_START=109 /DNA_END=2100 /DNA_ORIENTATION=+